MQDTISVSCKAHRISITTYKTKTQYHLADISLRLYKIKLSLHIANHAEYKGDNDHPQYIKQHYLEKTF